jgi:hypothetical protein
MMCSNEVYDLPTGCPGSYAEAEAAEYLRELVASGGHIPGDGKIIVVGGGMGATTVRVLNELGHGGIGVMEAAPTVEWTGEMSDIKYEAGRMLQPKHASVFTKTTPPSAKARKAARRRAKAGRRNARR